MPVPEILDLDPATDVRFRDFYGRHHNRIMSRGGNLILTMYHHISGTQANVSAAEIVSLDTNENAQYDLLLSSGAPLSEANLTNANIATWSAGSLLSIKPGLTSIRSANVSVGNLILQANAVARLDNCIIRPFQKTVGKTAGDTVEICTITQFGSAYSAELNVVQSSAVSGTSPKLFKFVVSYNATANTWRRLVPLTSSSAGIWNVEIRVNNNVTTLRFVRTLTTTIDDLVYGCTLTVYQSRANPVTIADATTTLTGVTLSTSVYNNTLITQVSGNVGIGTDNPTSLLDVAGIAKAGKLYSRENFTGTPSLPQGAYMSWNTLTGGFGETSFLNKYGTGSAQASGFYFYNSTGNGTSTEFNDNTLLASFTPGGITIHNASGCFIAPGSIIKTLFATGKDANINEGVTISTTSFNKTTWGTTWATVATFTYTPKSDSSRLMFRFDDDYIVGGFGNDNLKSRMTVDNVEVAFKQQLWQGSNGGTGTRSGAIFPIFAIFKNTSTAQKTIRIQVYLNDSDDTLTVSATNWMFELLERKT